MSDSSATSRLTQTLAPTSQKQPTIKFIQTPYQNLYNSKFQDEDDEGGDMIHFEDHSCNMSAMTAGEFSLRPGNFIDEVNHSEDLEPEFLRPSKANEYNFSSQRHGNLQGNTRQDFMTVKSPSEHFTFRDITKDPSFCNVWDRDVFDATPVDNPRQQGKDTSTSFMRNMAKTKLRILGAFPKRRRRGRRRRK